MAWNEPGGGNNNRDPWGGGNQGPPDLDEALKNLQKKFGGVFGGSGGGGGGGSASALLVLLVGALLVWGLMGFYQIDEQERAVVLRFGKYHVTARPGLQWNPPLIDEVIRVNTTKVRAASFREIMLTQDETTSLIAQALLATADRIAQGQPVDPNKSVTGLAHPPKRG